MRPIFAASVLASVCWLGFIATISCSSIQLYMDWILGASSFAFGVSEYVTVVGIVGWTRRSTKPFCSSSFKRRVTVVEDEFTLFLMSVNCRGMFLRSRIMSMCKSLDLLSKLRSLSTCEKIGSHSVILSTSLPTISNEYLISRLIRAQSIGRKTLFR